MSRCSHCHRPYASSTHCPSCGSAATEPVERASYEAEIWWNEQLDRERRNYFLAVYWWLVIAAGAALRLLDLWWNLR